MSIIILTSQIDFILERSKLHWDFSTLDKNDYDNYRFSNKPYDQPTLCRNNVTWFSFIVVRHAHTEGSNLDLAHETEEFLKSLNFSVTMGFSCAGA